MITSIISLIAEVLAYLVEFVCNFITNLIGDILSLPAFVRKCKKENIPVFMTAVCIILTERKESLVITLIAAIVAVLKYTGLGSAIQKFIGF